MLYQIFYVVNKVLGLISLLIFIYVILTWVAPRSAARYWLERVVDPFCAPLRPLARMMVYRWGCPFDLTCWLTMIAISLIQRLMWVIYYNLLF